MAVAERVEMAMRGGGVAAGARRARRRQPGGGLAVVVAIAVGGGLVEQFSGAAVMAMVQRLKAFAQARPGAAVAMPAPAAERQREHRPQQPSAASTASRIISPLATVVV